MVSIFSMVHGREVIMMQRCLYFQWYNGTMDMRGYNDAMVSIFQWYMEERL